ncbi:MAG: response regulator transcription factor [Candidatus Obscuribacterales bacterium]|nr:response regulator transcription factor [Cyanobacteria bacterium SZAS LIN-5]RTL39674.1 MAG: response regulator transcription factor [Candidatus Melainabacteria bacterium]
MTKILVVEDEHDLSIPIRDWLSREQYLVELVDNGIEALERLKVYKFDAIVLDLMIPGVNGMEVCKRFREEGGSTPILMLTAKNSVEEKEAGLDAGADDYLTKPFHLKELSARIRALLRRHTQPTSRELRVGNLVLDVVARTVHLNGEEIHFVPREFSLLEFFMRHPNQVFSAEAILDRVWASDTLASSDTIRTYIKILRKKLGGEGKESFIRTVHGVGYKIESPQ